MNWLDVVVLCLSLAVCGLAYKLWHYRLAIIKLQADMTLVLNELTQPAIPLRKPVVPLKAVRGHDYDIS